MFTRNSKQQRGSTLLVSMLFLLILTVLGIASVSTTGLQERMAHNSREQNLAFQAAEAALSEGEIWINGLRNGVPPTPQTSCGGNCATVAVWAADLPAHANITSQNYSWWQTNGRQHGVDPTTGQDSATRELSLVAGQPYYLIQELNAATLPNLQPGSLGTGFDYGASGPRYYQIYAYGIGQSSYTKGGSTRYFNVLLTSLYALPAF